MSSSTSGIDTNINTLNDIASELQSIKNKFPSSYTNKFAQPIGYSNTTGGGLKSDDEKWKSPYDKGVSCIGTASKELKLAYDAIDSLIKNCSNASDKIVETDKAKLKESIKKNLRIQDPNASEATIETFASLVVEQIYSSGKTGATVAVNGTISGWYKYDPETGDLEAGLTDSENTSEAETEAMTEAETEAQTEAETEAQTEVKTEAETEVQTEVKTEVKAEAKTEAQQKPTPTTQATQNNNNTNNQNNSIKQNSIPNNSNSNASISNNSSSNSTGTGGSSTTGVTPNTSTNIGTNSSNNASDVYETDNATIEGLETSSKTVETKYPTYTNKTTTMTAKVKVKPKTSSTNKSSNITKTAGIIAGGAAIPVVGLAANAVHNKVKEKSEDDLDEDRPTNGNKFWSSKNSNVINSEKEYY